MYSFQAKIGLKKMRKGENKNYRFVPFLPNAKLEIPKNSKKIQKFKKMPLWLHYKPKQVGNG